MTRAVCLLLLAAVALSACGGGDSSTDARRLVRETFANRTPIRSGNVSLDLRIATSGAGRLDRRPIDLRFTGPFDRRGPRRIPRFAFTLSAGLGGQSLTAGATSTGDAGFLALQGRDYALPPAAYASFRRSFAQVTEVARAPRRAPSLPWLSDPTVEGEADVAGVATEHVSGRVDVARLLASLERNRRPGSPELTASDRAQVERAVRDPRFELWTGKDDHLLRRVRVGFGLEVPAAARAQLGGLRSARVTLDYAVAGVNEPQTIPTPANPRPIAELRGRVQGLATAVQALLATASAGGGATGGGTGTSGQAEAYARCLAAAGNDQPAQQRCAALLPR